VRFQTKPGPPEPAKLIMLSMSIVEVATHADE
jgi:hypothetical protein